MPKSNRKIKLQEYAGLKIKVSYNVGLAVGVGNKSYTPEMLIIERSMRGTPLQYVKKIEKILCESIEELLKNFNRDFNASIFNLTYTCFRTEVVQRNKRATHKKSKWPLIIRRRIAQIMREIEVAILGFFVLARGELAHIFDTMDQICVAAKNGIMKKEFKMMANAIKENFDKTAKDKEKIACFNKTRMDIEIINQLA